MHSRRAALKAGLAAAGVAGGLVALPAQAAGRAGFDAHTVPDAVKALGGSTLAESKDVSLQAPEIAENGAVVSLTLASTLPGIRQLALLVEKNPNALVAVFHVNEWVEPHFTTRAKMAESSPVYAVAIGADGKAWYAKKEVKVTLGGCG